MNIARLLKKLTVGKVEKRRAQHFKCFSGSFVFIAGNLTFDREHVQFRFTNVALKDWKI